VQAAKDVIAALKAARTRDTQAELTLQTGYVTPEEALAIVREANTQGVKHIVVSHAATGSSAMSIPQMQEAIRFGAFLEFASVSTMGASPEIQPAAYAELMRKAGVDHVIMGSDFGQPGRPMPPDGLALYAGLMRRQGFTDHELYLMMAENPARAMGLPPSLPGGAH
jgi:imidazolonepropionase-like amidohydrolase